MTPIRSLSQQESALLSSLAAESLYLFSVDDAQRLSNGAAAKMLYRLSAKGWLERLERGKYRLLPLEAGPEPQWAEHEYLLAASLVEPYYLSYATALGNYGYSDFLTNTIWIATTKRKKAKFIKPTTYRFVTLAEEKFFGYTTEVIGGGSFNIAEREKAIADALDHPEYCGGALEAAKGLWFGSDELDFELLLAYCQKLGNRSVLKRLGYWLENLQVGNPDLLRKLPSPQDRNYSLLDPQGPKTGIIDSRWRMIVNIPERQLLEWQNH